MYVLHDFLFNVSLVSSCVLAWMLDALTKLLF